MSGSSEVKKWSVASNPRGLSMNIAHNVVVTCFEANTIQECNYDESILNRGRIKNLRFNCRHMR